MKLKNKFVCKEHYYIRACYRCQARTSRDFARRFIRLPKSEPIVVADREVALKTGLIPKDCPRLEQEE